MGQPCLGAHPLLSPSAWEGGWEMRVEGLSCLPHPGKLDQASELEGGAGVGLQDFLGKCRQSLPSAPGDSPPTTASLPLHCTCHSLSTEECVHPDDGPSVSSCLASSGWTDRQKDEWTIHGSGSGAAGSGEGG